MGFKDFWESMSLLEAFVIIASMWACQFISCERVMVRSLKCCTLSTLTGLLVQQSDNSWGGDFARGPRIISLVFVKFMLSLWSVIYQCRPWLRGVAVTMTIILLHCALSLAAQCIVIGPVCGFIAKIKLKYACVCVCVCVSLCGWVRCYHDNSKLRASIFTKLGL